MCVIPYRGATHEGEGGGMVYGCVHTWVVVDVDYGNIPLRTTTTPDDADADDGRRRTTTRGGGWPCGRSVVGRRARVPC